MTTQPYSLFYPYYGQLTANEQAVYRQLYALADAGQTTAAPCAPIVVSSVKRILHALLCDHPELFWLDTCSSRYKSDNTVVEITLRFNDLAGTQHRRRFEQAANKLLSGLERKSPAEREKAVHDTLLRRVVYDLKAPYNQTAYSALVLGRTVCAGYTRAFQLLLTRLGIPCYFCEGKGLGGASVARRWADHAWVKVKLGNAFYNVDPTWDDTQYASDGLIDYSQYNVPDSVFEKTHISADTCRFLPACRGTEYTYERLYGAAPQTALLSQMGVKDYTSVSFLRQYYDACTAQLTAAGKGTHTLHFLLESDAVKQQINDAISSNAYKTGFLDRTVKNLHLNGYSFSLQSTFTSMNGKWHLKQTVTLR